MDVIPMFMRCSELIADRDASFIGILLFLEGEK